MRLTRKIFTIGLLLYVAGLPIATAQSVWIAPDQYSSVVEVVYRSDGRFMASDNKSQLDYIKSQIEKYSAQISSKECRIWVESYSKQDGAGVEADRKSAHVLSNLLKSYMILNMGIKETDFTTKNYSGTYDKRQGVTVITIGLRYPFEYTQPLQQIDVSGILQDDFISSPTTASNTEWRYTVDTNKIVSPKFLSANTLLYGGGDGTNTDDVRAEKRKSTDVSPKQNPMFKLPGSLTPISNAPSSMPAQTPTEITKVEQRSLIVYGPPARRNKRQSKTDTTTAITIIVPKSAPDAPTSSFGSLQSSAAAVTSATESVSQGFGPKSFGTALKPVVAASDLTAQAGNTKKSKAKRRSKKAQPQAVVLDTIIIKQTEQKEQLTYSQPVSIPAELQPKTGPTTASIISPPPAPTAPSGIFGSLHSSAAAITSPTGGVPPIFGPKSFGAMSAPSAASSDLTALTSSKDKKSKSTKQGKKHQSQDITFDATLMNQIEQKESLSYNQQPSIPLEFQPKTGKTTASIIVTPPSSTPSAPAVPSSQFGQFGSTQGAAIAPPVGGDPQSFGPKSFGTASKPAFTPSGYVEPTTKRGAGGEKPIKAGKIRKNDMPKVSFNSDGSMQIDATGIGKALSVEAVRENVKVERVQQSATKRAEKELLVRDAINHQRAMREAKGRFAIAGFGLNALTAIVAVPSVQLDFYIHNRFSVSLEGTYSNWDLLGDNYRNRIVMVSPEVRVWVGKPKKFTGFYVGLYASVGQYNFRFNSAHGVQSSFYSAGVSLGYVLPLGAKSNFFVDFGLAGGYVSEQGEDYFSYKNENFIKDSFVRTGFAPTKARITFIYRFFNQTKR